MRGKYAGRLIRDTIKRKYDEGMRQSEEKIK